MSKPSQKGLELAAGRTGADFRVAVGKRPDTARKVRRETQFTASEDAAIAAVAEVQGFGFQEWVVVAVRAALTRPSYGQAKLEALTASNAQSGSDRRRPRSASDQKHSPRAPVSHWHYKLSSSRTSQFKGFG